jgi:hypothetical protein
MLFQGDRILSERLRKGKCLIEFCDIFIPNIAATLCRPVDTGVIALGRATVNLLGRWCTWYFRHHLLLLLQSFFVLLLSISSFFKTFLLDLADYF